MKHIRRLRQITQRFFGSHGFALVITLCVAVIAASALWSRRTPTSTTSPTPPRAGDVIASSLWQQRLPSATPTPLPSSQPPIWASPLEEYVVLREFSETQMTPSGVTGVWQVHQAVDLGAPAGMPVAAMADGRVTACAEESLCGAWIELTHGDGSISRYESLSLLGAFQKGDTVRAGQTIGFVGNTHLEETDMGPHLHVTVLVDGQAVDPLSLLS